MTTARISAAHVEANLAALEQRACAETRAYAGHLKIEAVDGDGFHYLFAGKETDRTGALSRLEIFMRGAANCSMNENGWTA